MNLTYFTLQIRENVANKNNSAVNIRFVARTSDIRNFSETIRSAVETSEVATLACTVYVSPTRLPHVNDFQTCKPNGTMTSEQAFSFLWTVA